MSAGQPPVIRRRAKTYEAGGGISAPVLIVQNLRG